MDSHTYTLAGNLGQWKEGDLTDSWSDLEQVSKT